MFASNFTIDDEYLKHLRGQDNLKTFGQKTSIKSGNMMTNYFCSTCGTLIYRVGSALPGKSILRIGIYLNLTINDVFCNNDEVPSMNSICMGPSCERRWSISSRTAWTGGMAWMEPSRWRGWPTFPNRRSFH